MSRMDNLRNRSKLSQEIYDKKVQRAYSAVKDYMNSETSMLTIARRVADTDSGDSADIAKFSQEIATCVTDAVLDPVQEFRDVCNLRGYTEKEIESIVQNYSRLFQLAVNGTLEEKTKAVAEYLQYNRPLYEDLECYK